MSHPLSARIGRDHHLARLALLPLLLAALYFGYRLVIEAWAINIIRQETQRLDETGQSLNLVNLEESFTNRMKRDGATELNGLLRVSEGLLLSQRAVPSYWRAMDVTNKVESEEVDTELEKLFVSGQPLVEAVRKASKYPGPLQMKIDFNSWLLSPTIPSQLASLLLFDASRQIRKKDSEKVIADLQACVDLIYAYEISGSFLLDLTVVEWRICETILVSMNQNIWNKSQLLELEKIHRDLENLSDKRITDLSIHRSKYWAARTRGYGYGMENLSYIRLSFDLPSDSAESLLVFKEFENMGSQLPNDKRNLTRFIGKITGRESYGIGRLSGFGTTRQTLNPLLETWQTKNGYSNKAAGIAIALKRYQLDSGHFPNQLADLLLDGPAYYRSFGIGYEVKDEKAYLWRMSNSMPDHLPEEGSQEYTNALVCEIQ